MSMRSLRICLSILLCALLVMVAVSPVSLAQEKPKLRVVVVTHGLTKDVTEMEYLQTFADAAGVEIEWEQYRATFLEKKTAVQASGDVPDIFISGWFDTITDADFVTFRALYQPLEDLIPKYAPNIQKMFEEKPSLKYLSTAADGHIYALPKYQRYWPKNQIRMMINKVWLDNLGLEIPETWDELYDVLVAFKTRDPNGNGVADEIPMDWAPGTGGFNVTVLLAGYGIAAPYPYGNGLYVENGKVGNFFADPRYKELVQFLNKCFKEGLVNPEVFTQDYTKFQAVGRGTEQVPLVGFTFGWEPQDRLGSEWAPQYITIPPLRPNKDYTGPMYWDFNYFDLNYGRNYITMTTKCQHKEAAMRFIDQFYSPEGGLQVLFGSLGECIRKNEDGSYTILPPADPAMDPGTWKWTSAIADAGPMYISDTMVVELGEDMQALAKYDEVYQPYLNAVSADSVWPGPFVKYAREETGELADLWLSLGEVISTNYSMWISEGGVEKEWDAYVRELNALGLQRWIQIHQQAYDRLMKDNAGLLEMPK
jgi:putative aldouronate transport system substrate-binding protein